MRLAAAPITWGVCELPGWGSELPYARVLDEMAALGFRGTELGPEGYLPADPARLHLELRQRGLALVGAFCPVTFHNPAQAAASLGAGEALARFLILFNTEGCTEGSTERPLLVAADAGDAHRRAVAGRVGAGDGLDDAAWSRLGDGLTRLAEACVRIGVRVVFHPHAGTYVETEGEVERLLSHTPSDLVGLCLDTGHLAYGGADPVRVCRNYGSRIWHVHAKDIRPSVLERVRRQGADYATAVGEGVFAPLGDGGIDFPALVHTLRAAAYDGWCVLEQDVRLGDPWPAQDPGANARRSAAYWRDLTGEGTEEGIDKGTDKGTDKGDGEGGQ